MEMLALKRSIAVVRIIFSLFSPLGAYSCSAAQSPKRLPFFVFIIFLVPFRFGSILF